MPRGWRETQKPETADSQRGRRKPDRWRRREWDKESNLSSVSSHDSIFEQAMVSETMKSSKFSPIQNEGLDAKLTNETESLASGTGSGHNSTLYSLMGIVQPEAKSTNVAEGASDYSSLTPSGSSNAYNKVTNSNSMKPLSLLPFLGMTSTVGVTGPITSPTSAPQWVQLLNKQDAEKLMQDLNSGLYWIILH